LTWQLSQVQTVYGYNVAAIAIFHSSSAYQIIERYTSRFEENMAFLIGVEECTWVTNKITFQLTSSFTGS